MSGGFELRRLQKSPFIEDAAQSRSWEMYVNDLFEENDFLASEAVMSEGTGLSTLDVAGELFSKGDGWKKPRGVGLSSAPGDRHGLPERYRGGPQRSAQRASLTPRPPDMRDHGKAASPPSGPAERARTTSSW